MLNILKMDLYRMFKSKSFYVLNIALIVIILSLGLMMRFTLNMDYEKAKDSSFTFSSEDGSLDTGDSSITKEDYNTAIAEIKEDTDVSLLLNIQYSEMIISTLIAIFIALFICSELDSGFIKNVVPLKNSRVNIVISKNIIVALFIIVQAVIAIAVSIIATIIISGKINIINTKEVMIFMAFQVLLRIAFSSLLILVGYLLKSKAAVMTIGILLAVNIHGVFLGFLDKFVSIFGFNLSELTIIGNSQITKFETIDYQRIIVISIVYFIIYNIISIIRTKKMEIN